MITCPHCGAQMRAQSKFCSACGSRLNDTSGAAPANQSAASQTVSDQPTPAAASVHQTAADQSTPIQTPTEQPASAAGNTPDSVVASPVTEHKKNKLWIIAVSAISAVAVALGAGYWAYQSEIIGGHTVPVVSQISADGKTNVTADEMERHLKNRGFTAIKRTQEFARHSRGDFVRYDGVREGTRASTDTPITVVESLGPGVPQGTAGKQESDAVKAVADMGVPLSRAEVVVSSKSQVPAGSVVMTAPNDGTALAEEDADRGIVLGVASDGKGVGADLVGEDKDKVRELLESDGFSVTMKPRFSSEQYVGKMVTSDPQPGVETNARDVTVYYGVDSASVKEMFTDRTVGGADGTAMKIPDAALAGRYCKADGSDCFTLDVQASQYGGEYITASNSEIPGGSGRNMLETAPGLQGLQAAPSQNRGSNDRLIDLDTGAFELYPYGSLSSMYCNGEYQLINGPGSPICTENGWQRPSTPDSSPSTSFDRITYRMEPYYLYYAVGANASAVEQTNIFDVDALTQAKSEKPVDTTRPFIVVRDPSLYKTTEISYTEAPSNSMGFKASPYAPTLLTKNGTRDPAKVGIKPAPSNNTVYYLDESSLIGDWTANAEPIESDKSDKADKEDAAKSDKIEKSWDEIKQAVQQGDLSDIAGQFCDKSGGCITIDEKGNLTPNSKEADQLVSDRVSISTILWGEHTFPGFGKTLYFMGPDEDFRCVDDESLHGYEAVYEGECTGAGTVWPTQFFYIPAGTSMEQLDGIAGAGLEHSLTFDSFVAADTSKDYLYMPAHHMNDMPDDNFVYYRVS